MTTSGGFMNAWTSARKAWVGLPLIAVLLSTGLTGCATTDQNMKDLRQRRYAVDQYNIGLGYEKEENLPMALNHYHRSLNASPRPATMYQIGHIYAEQGDYVQAQSFLQQAVDDNPNYDLARLELQKVNLILEERAAASAAASASGTQTGPRSSDNIISEFTAIDVPGTLPNIDEVTQQLFPSLTNAESDDAKQEERRLYNYMATQKIALPSAEFHRRKAEEFALRGLLDEAIKEYQDTLQFEPNDLEARLGLARVYERAGRMKAAEEELLHAIELNPQSATAHFNTGNFYFRQELNQNARDSFLRAVEIQPDYRPALNNLAATQIKLGEYQAAQITLERLLGFDPQFLNAHLNLGILFDDHLKDPDKALYHYKRYLELGGTDRERVEQWIAEIEARQRNR